ncbi:hypothetical protein PUN28_005966 [Cardiocondyla obscurior]|uniref:Uncharacterized protein n=1 Tax=Cardiocondyla obscurior TaxID=286306 RepID=A0AAW2G9B0_9HYME
MQLPGGSTRIPPARIPASLLVIINGNNIATITGKVRSTTAADTDPITNRIFRRRPAIPRRRRTSDTKSPSSRLSRWRQLYGGRCGARNSEKKAEKKQGTTEEEEEEAREKEKRRKQFVVKTKGAGVVVVGGGGGESRGGSGGGGGIGGGGGGGGEEDGKEREEEDREGDGEGKRGSREAAVVGGEQSGEH